MNITVFGVGYVGLTAGVCFAEMGNNVQCMDIDKEKIGFLKKLKSPIYEPELEDLLQRNVKNQRLSFTDNFEKALDFSDVLFIALGTPTSKDGGLELGYIDDLIELIKTKSNSSKIIVMKSTVPPGTCLNIQSLLDNSDNKNSFEVVSNPEFMKEGNAINDFLKPDRIIIGTRNNEVFKVLEEIYSPFNRNTSRIIQMDPTSSELTKFAANVMLATRISFMNELSGLCEKIDADIESVREGMASDPRIGSKFLYAGCGYGGSCFPKDVKGLMKIYEDNQIDPRIASATHSINEQQKDVIVEKVKKYFGSSNLAKKNIAILGLAFKPETDDLREAPSLHVIDRLSEHVKQLNAYDPLSHRNLEYLQSIVDLKEDIYSCCEGADAIIICTEWKEFRSMDLQKISRLVNTKAIFDGRNIFNKEKLQNQGWDYFNIGQGNVNAK